MHSHRTAWVTQPWHGESTFEFSIRCVLEPEMTSPRTGQRHPRRQLL